MTLIENIIIFIISIIVTIFIFIRIGIHGDKTQFKNMKNDGLSDKDIIRIMGINWFKKNERK